MTISIGARVLAVSLFAFASASVVAAQQLEGHVYGGGGPIAKSTVTLWAAGQSAPRKLAETQTKDDGACDLRDDGRNAGGDVLYLVAQGGEPTVGDSKGPNNAIALMATLGTEPPLAGCVTRVQSDACAKLFAAATPPGGAAPTDTLSAAQAVARHPWNQPQKLFALLDAFYPVPKGQRWREAPFIPYLNYAPVTWPLALTYAGGGLNSLGGIAIDGDDNAWAADNFLVGA